MQWLARDLGQDAPYLKAVDLLPIKFVHMHIV